MGAPPSRLGLRLCSLVTKQLSACPAGRTLGTTWRPSAAKSGRDSRRTNFKLEGGPLQATLTQSCRCVEEAHRVTKVMN